MSFDRLLYIYRLKMAGIDEPLARAHAEALRDALSEAVATKADVDDLKRHIDEEVKRVERKIDQLENKINHLENKMDNRFEIVSREFIIKGAGGLVLVSSLMIGLKLFH